jgi:hypothetical protein
MNLEISRRSDWSRVLAGANAGHENQRAQNSGYLAPHSIIVAQVPDLRIIVFRPDRYWT